MHINIEREELGFYVRLEPFSEEGFNKSFGSDHFLGSQPTINWGITHFQNIGFQVIHYVLTYPFMLKPSRGFPSVRKGVFLANFSGAPSFPSGFLKNFLVVI